MQGGHSQKEYEPSSSRKLHMALFGRPTLASNDLRGFIVFDRNHKKIGTIAEVYSDRDTLKPRYVEIIPFKSRMDGSIAYPYDYVKWLNDDGPAFISSTAEALFAHEEYSLEHVMQSEGEDLVTFSDVLEADSRKLVSPLEYSRCL